MVDEMKGVEKQEIIRVSKFVNTRYYLKEEIENFKNLFGQEVLEKYNIEINLDEYKEEIDLHPIHCPDFNSFMEAEGYKKEEYESFDLFILDKKSYKTLFLFTFPHVEPSSNILFLSLLRDLNINVVFYFLHKSFFLERRFKRDFIVNELEKITLLKLEEFKDTENILQNNCYGYLVSKKLAKYFNRMISYAPMVINNSKRVIDPTDYKNIKDLHLFNFYSLFLFLNGQEKLVPFLIQDGYTHIDFKLYSEFFEYFNEGSLMLSQKENILVLTPEDRTILEIDVKKEEWDKVIYIKSSVIHGDNFFPSAPEFVNIINQEIFKTP